VEKSDRGRGDAWHQIKVLLQLWSVRFDYVFELGDGHRARLFAMLSRARRRYSVKTSSPLKWIERLRFTASSSFDWQTCHRVEKDYHSVGEFLPLPAPIPPLIFERNRTQTWEPGRALTDFCVLQVGSRQGFNRWHREGWREVARHLLGRMENIVVSCGPVAHELDEANWLRQELGPRLILTHGKTTWPELADLLYRAKLYVGPNTAAMHLAAACQCPVVALFGPSIEDYWHPWQVHYRIVTSHGYAPVADTAERYLRVKKRTMEEIEAGDVTAACDELLAG
jgi:heptosyltransferase III